jgi:hypothetical protein
MPVYILDMLDLSAEIKSAFEKGELFIGDASHPHCLNLQIRGCTWSSNNSSTLISSTDVSIV